MKRYLVDYCFTCRKNTKHEVIRCTTPFAARLFFGIFSAGISEMIGHRYQCECTKCGRITEIDG